MASSLDVKATSLADTVLLDLSSKSKYWSEVGYSRKMMAKNMMAGGHSILRQLSQSLSIFKDGVRIGMLIGSDCWGGSEEMS